MEKEKRRTPTKRIRIWMERDGKRLQSRRIGQPRGGTSSRRFPDFPDFQKRWVKAGKEKKSKQRGMQ